MLIMIRQIGFKVIIWNSGDPIIDLILAAGSGGLQCQKLFVSVQKVPNYISIINIFSYIFSFIN